MSLVSHWQVEAEPAQVAKSKVEQPAWHVLASELAQADDWAQQLTPVAE
jgi:hypothetical protein